MFINGQFRILRFYLSLFYANIFCPVAVTSQTKRMLSQCIQKSLRLCPQLQELHTERVSYNLSFTKSMRMVPSSLDIASVVLFPNILLALNYFQSSETN
jgi:hypothetical protein